MQSSSAIAQESILHQATSEGARAIRRLQPPKKTKKLLVLFHAFDKSFSKALHPYDCFRIAAGATAFIGAICLVSMKHDALVS